MAKFSELVKGFRSNVRDGIPSTLIFTGDRVHLTAERGDGYVGICGREALPTKGEGQKAFSAAAYQLHAGLDFDHCEKGRCKNCDGEQRAKCEWEVNHADQEQSHERTLDHKDD